VFGLGNGLRGDDAAGLVATDHVRDLVGPEIAVEAVAGDPISLLDAWRGLATAVVVDAMDSGSAPGTVLRIDGHAYALPVALRGTSTHAVGLAEAVELGRALRRLPARLVVYGIEGHCFETGGTITPTVAEAARRVADEIAREIEAPPG
jgi:hydrogenase maturation protease